jgi:ABC-type transporter lipoprotein component MlaA
MKDSLEMTDAELKAELETVQKFARVVLFTVLGLCGLFVVTGAIVSMLMH